MDPRYKALEKKFEELQTRLADPALDAGSSAFLSLAKEFKKLEPIYQKIQWLKRVLQEESSLREMESDKDMRALAEEELKKLAEDKARLTAEMDDFLTPRDPQDEKNVIMEIRAGAGGDEAAIFGGDLFRMYSRYAAEKGFSVEVFDSHQAERGGFKEVIFQISGPEAYRHFKFERGVHRVQRVPETEASGRVHTSTATVAALPEADEVDVEINPADLRIDTYRASGAGGQHVNKTESAIRITHIPTGVVVACQDERSQIKNRARAMSLLRSTLYQQKLEKAEAERRDLRRSQVGTGDRSEKIRTYNFPQDRITDHRLNQNFHNLPHILEGNMDEIVKALLDLEKSQRLAASS